MSRDWTPEQRDAIVTHAENLLVSAAAGSGKTAVLAERCASLVCDGPDPCEADELLVVTFTVASAEEMRRRIGAALSKRVVGTADLRLARQTVLLAGAQIGTIHGLCSSVLRRHFHDVGLDPGFRLLDNEEARLLRSDTADAVVERALEDDRAVLTGRLVDEYANGSPRQIASVLIGLHDHMASLCDPKQWLAERRARLVEAGERPITESMLGRAAVATIVGEIDTLAAETERLTDAVRRARVGPYVDALAEVGTALDDWKDALLRRPYDQAADIVGQTGFARLPTVRGEGAHTPFTEAVKSVKKRAADLTRSGLLLFTEPELQDGVTDTLWAVDHLVALTEAFDARYAAAKSDGNTLDFADLERRALDLLRDPATGGPTPVALDYRKRFRHVLVDEYQDVNELQDTLLAMLCREEDGNLFCVGDVKQSIYRFRQADPARFLHRAARYRGQGGGGRVIDMRRNFRSRGPLLEAVNGVFETLMTEGSAELNYDDTQRLVPGAASDDVDGGFAGTPVELHVIEKSPADAATDVEGDEREAALAAARISELLGRTGRPPRLVIDGGVPRPMRPGDVAVLLRSVHIKAERFAAVLRRAGLPVLSDSSTGFFQSTEVQDVLAVLRLIDNTRSEYDLASHLRSPLCQWPDAEDRLARIRLAYPTKIEPWFHRAAARYAAEQKDDLAAALKDAFARLSDWRAFAAGRSVADVVWHVLDVTHYVTWVAGLPDGEQRVANLMDLHERARQFDKFRRPTLARFLHFLTNLEDQTDLGMPSVNTGEENAIRVLSIHKSKGLEFPVVVLPDLGKDFNLRDAGGTLVLDEDVGIALKVVDADREVQYPSLASTVASAGVRRRSLAEEMRVLYVAMTRPREHLILIGTEKAGVADTWDAWRDRRGPTPAGEVLAGRSMLDWVGPAAEQTNGVRPGSYARHVHTAAEVDAMADDLLASVRRRDQPSVLQDGLPLSDPPLPSPAVKQTVRRLRFEYDKTFRPLTREPAVTSVTAATKRGGLAPGGERPSRAGVVAFDGVLRPPRCVTPDRTLSPVDRGALTHAVLQRLDFTGDVSPTGVRAQVARLAERRFVRGDDAAQADVDAVAWFAATELGRRLREADDLRREFEIVYPAPPLNAADGPELGGDDRVMVRGRIDALLVDYDGLVLIDYKTDQVTKETLPARIDFYRPQLAAYRDHLRQITGRPVKETWLVFTTPRQIVRLIEGSSAGPIA